MSDIYCGAKKVPKNKHLGSMKECVGLGKITYWGIHKIDSKTLTTIGLDAKKSKSASKVLIKSMGVKGKIRKIKKDMPYVKDAAKKKEMEKKLKELGAEFNVMAEEYRRIKKSQEDNKIEKAAKKVSKKASVKKTSKKASKKASTKASVKKTVKKASKKTSKK
jgi:hypothetical protein